MNKKAPVGVCLVTFFFPVFVSAQQKPVASTVKSALPEDRIVPANNDAEKLPVRRVVLYKNGVGYFEHLGRVRRPGCAH